MTISERFQQLQTAQRAALQKHCAPGETSLHVSPANFIPIGRFVIILLVAAAIGGGITSVLLGPKVTILKWAVWLAITTLIGTWPLSRVMKSYLVGVTDQRLLVVLLQPQSWVVRYDNHAQVFPFAWSQFPSASIGRRGLKARVNIHGTERLRFDIPLVGPGKPEAEAILASIGAKGPVSAAPAAANPR